MTSTSSNAAVQQDHKAPVNRDETLAQLHAAFDALESDWRGSMRHGHAEAQTVGNTTERKAFNQPRTKQDTP